MQKLLIMCLLVTGISVSTLSAQITDRMVPHSGVMYEIVTFETTQNTPPVTFNRGYYTFNLGSYFMLAHVNDVASVGIDGSVNFGINFPTTGRGTVVTFVAQTPVFAMGRVGTNATSYNEQGIGAGAGIGLNYTYFNDIADPNSGNKFRSGFVVPAAVAEVSLRSRGSALTVRGHISLASIRSNVRYTNPNFPDSSFKLGNWGVGLISSF